MGAQKQNTSSRQLSLEGNCPKIQDYVRKERANSVPGQGAMSPSRRRISHCSTTERRDGDIAPTLRRAAPASGKFAQKRQIFGWLYLLSRPLSCKSLDFPAFAVMMLDKLIGFRTSLPSHGPDPIPAFCPRGRRRFRAGPPRRARLNNRIAGRRAPFCKPRSILCDGRWSFNERFGTFEVGEICSGKRMCLS